MRAIEETDQGQAKGDDLIFVRSNQFSCSLRDGVENCLGVGGRDIRL